MLTMNTNSKKTIALTMIASAATILTTVGSAIAATTQCEFVAGTTTQTTTYGSWSQTDGGVFWDTWSRKCTNHKEGDAIWCTYILLRQCTAGGGIGIGITPQGPGGQISGNFSYTWVPHVTSCTSGPGTQDWCSTETKCIAFWESDPASARDQRAPQLGMGGISIDPRPTGDVYYFNEVRFTNDRIFNAWSDSTVTWDGKNIPYNSAIALIDEKLGPHVYKVMPNASLNTGIAAFIFNIDLQPSFDLLQVDEFRDVVPMTTLTFTNNSEFDIDVDFRAAPELEGLVVEVFNNQQHVLSGQSIMITAEFYNEDGYAFIPGAKIPCPIKVYDSFPGGTVIAEYTAIVHEPCEGDLNADGVVDAADLDELFRQVDLANSFDVDTTIASDDFLDVLNLVIANFGAECRVQLDKRRDLIDNNQQTLDLTRP